MLTSPYSEEQLSQPIDMQSWKTFTLFCHTPNLTVFSPGVSKLLETSLSSKLQEEIMSISDLMSKSQVPCAMEREQISKVSKKHSSFNMFLKSSDSDPLPVLN